MEASAPAVLSFYMATTIMFTVYPLICMQLFVIYIQLYIIMVHAPVTSRSLSSIFLQYLYNYAVCNIYTVYAWQPKPLPVDTA